MHPIAVVQTMYSETAPTINGIFQSAAAGLLMGRKESLVCHWDRDGAKAVEGINAKKPEACLS